MSNQGSVVKPCGCVSSIQDKIYGQGNRLHNFCKHPTSKEDMKGVRCTVCKKVKGGF